MTDDVSTAYVPARRRRYNIKPRKLRVTVRDQDFYRRYLNGETLQEIGTRWGITREYVRQRLKLMGITRKDGGFHRRAQELAVVRAIEEKERERRRSARRAKTCEQWLGVSPVEFEEIAGEPYQSVWIQLRNYEASANPILRCYLGLMRSAKRRHIPWSLTFRAWWDKWVESGKWDLRGTKSGDYCMGRENRHVGFTVENARICTFRENSQRTRAQDAPRGRRTPP